MNAQRAVEIAGSPVMVNVTYEGIPVYIQYVDAANEKARIFFLDNSEYERNVSLHTLMEN